jgi:hypothetical protein
VVGYTQEDVGEPMLKDFPAEEVFEDGSEVVVGLATVGSKAFLTLNGSLAGVVDNAPIDVTGGAQIDAKQVLVKKIEVTSLDGLTESEALHLLGIK